MSYSLKVLYSGSTGNAALLQTKETTVLIDAGRSARCLCAAIKAAGCDPDAISAIFLTHEHGDHTAALEVFLKHHPMPVHAAGEIAELKLQPQFTLQESYVTTEGERIRAIRYVADFSYWQRGEPVVEDVKSRATATAQYKLKKKLMQERFGISVMEV